jgi:hypothetical protein
MPIQIIDNFDLTSAKPIDNRIVVGPSSFYVNRDLISHKYAGLRIWDLNDSIPYVWTGATWSNENSSGSVTSQNGTASYISKFVGAGNIIANSIIYELASSPSNKIGINTLSPSETLDVNGNVKATLFKGSAWSSGVGLGNINLGTNGNNLFPGSTIGLSNIQNGASGQILVAGLSSPAWTNPSAISSGSSIVTTENASSSDHYLTFVSVSSGTTGIKTNFLSPIPGGGGPGTTGGIRFKPSTSQLLMSSYWQDPAPPNVPVSSRYHAGVPVYSFYGDTDTGMYSGAPNNVNFSTGGSVRLIINNSQVKVVNANLVLPYGTAGAPAIYFDVDSNSGFYRPSTNQIGMAISGIKRFIARTGVSSDFEFFSPNGTQKASLIVDNSLGFSLQLNSVEKILVNSDGVSIISSLPIEDWDVTSLTTDRWASNFAGTTTPLASPYDFPAVNYDRIIYADHGTSGTAQALIFVETTASNFILLGRSAPNGYSSCNAIVPAGKKFRLRMDAVSGSSTISFTIYKFGRN